MSLERFLGLLPALDSHAHNLLRWEVSSTQAYAGFFSEACDDHQIQLHAERSLFYRRSLVDLSLMLECDPDQVPRRRLELGEEALTRRCLLASQLEGILMDDGLTPESTHPISWHIQFVPVGRVLRLERLAEDLFSDAPDFSTFLEGYRSALEDPAVVAFKSIVAYRTGLRLEPVEPWVAEARFKKLRRSLPPGQRLRLIDKPLLDYLVGVALEIAARRAKPVQFHTGFGDPDLDLLLSNPLQLRWALENPAFRGAPIVLLHAGYPYVREAGYLASVYSQVHVDLGLAVPFLSVAGMRAVVSGLLELAPTSKIMYSSDASRIPELYYLGSLWARRTLAHVLDESRSQGELSAGQAEEIGAAILLGNARRLYGQIVA